jgi:hypothetical protein
MKKMFTSLVAGLGLLATIMAMPAQSVSIQDFFNPDKGFTSDVRQNAERLALTTEAYRNLKAGRVTQAACIDEELTSETNLGAPGLGGLQAHLLEARDRTESVEGYILKALDISCPANNKVAQVSASAPKAVFQPTPVREFFAKFPQGLDKIRALNLAFSTQALRTARAGFSSRGQCITTKLVVSRTANDDGFGTPPTEFQNAAKGLANAESVEKLIIDSIATNCGEEPP